MIEVNSAYEAELNTAVSAAVSAGKKIEQMREEGLELEYKDDEQTDLVTNADFAAEDIIKKTIQEQYPEDGIISEESATIRENSERMWVIDPIDGTNNFERGWTYYCVSIALRSNKEYLVGAVHSPQSGLNRTYLACKDTPAYRFKGPSKSASISVINTSDKSKLSDSVCTCFLHHSNRGRRKIERDIIDVLLERGANYRETGSAALTISEIAEGVRDCRFDIIDEWDYAAASLILERAGGKFEQLPEDSIIATNDSLHYVFREIVNEVLKNHPMRNLRKD